MGREFMEDLESKLQDKEFAKAFGAETAKTDFAITLVKARRRCQMTQAELATAHGVRQSYIAKLERGDANPTIGAAGRILAALELRLSTAVLPLMPMTTWSPQTSSPRRSESATAPPLIYNYNAINFPVVSTTNSAAAHVFVEV
ncbi:MAG: helix-turn-helix transcriptional regulator [Dehalococcoidia bacterium]